MNELGLNDLEQIMRDAVKWRELTDLLREKAYKTMTPTEISEQFPNLRQLYREVGRRTNGHSRSATR
ncbi:MAG: hypothetical protein QG637_1820 [Chloroflexota bacterium]|nr:hypothetical protein [Chloroflexota bacterium]